jgi:SecD/SecF fusion protein
MIGYYYFAGFVATLAVLMNMVLILGAMAMLNATFTLPGIAGIVLTIGMAVDANVLIFERLREEQQRGLSLRMALRNAYDRAFSAIFDGNVTTGITSVCLYLFGSEEVKGFGLTLMLGIVASLFTALFVTKTIFGILIENFHVEKLGSLPLTFPKWDQMLRPNVDWMSKAWMFYAFSGVFIVIGLGAFGMKWHQGQLLDIEFASGTSVQFDLKQPMRIDEVRAIIDKASRQNPDKLASPSVVSVGTDDKTYEVVTPIQNASGVREIVVSAMAIDSRSSSRASSPARASTLTPCMGQQVVPIESDTQEIAGFVPPGLSSHPQGVAIVLRDLSPPLSRARSRRASSARARAAGRPDDDPVPRCRRRQRDGTDEPTATPSCSSPIRVPARPGRGEVGRAAGRADWRLVNEASTCAPACSASATSTRRSPARPSARR